jgi:hypothetical protein
LKNAVERLIVRSRGGIVTVADLPAVIPTAARGATPVAATEGVMAPVQAHAGAVAVGPSRPSAQMLFERIVTRRESFWSAVYSPFMSRDLTRDDVRAIVTAGLQHTRGNYKMLLELFNMEPADYKRFLNFLRKHQCHMPFQQFRVSESIRTTADTRVTAAFS